MTTMIRIKHNVWAALGGTIHRVAFGDGPLPTIVETVCGETGRTIASYHVDERAGVDVAPAVHVDLHCQLCVATRSSRCICGFRTVHAPTSSAFHAAHRDHHLRVYPGVDVVTRNSLDRLVEVHREREQTAAGILQPPVEALS